MDPKGIYMDHGPTRTNRAAIADRLSFGGHIIETGTDSYRLAHTLTRE